MSTDPIIKVLKSMSTYLDIGEGERAMIAQAAGYIADLTAELSALRACEGTDTDTCPRYSMKRMRDEIAKAKEYARAEALEEAAKVAEGNAKSFNFQHALAEGDDMSVGAKSAQLAIAASIRALMVKP